MKLVIGSYVLDGVSSTAYEQFITYYQNTPASYITNQDIERWNTPADLSDLASKSYVMDKIGAIPAPDLSPYATISYVTEEIEKNEKVIASAVSYVNDKIDSIEMPDLSSYATQSYVTDQINSINFDIDTTGLVNESRLQDYVSGAIAAHGSSAYTSLQNYTNQKISDLNISSYATKDWVTEHITEIASGGEITLDGYATELWVNNQGFLKQDNLAGYVTNPIMAATLAAYMKKSDMISYASKDYVDNAILQAATGEVDLSMYALKSEIPSLNNYYNKQYIDQNLASKSYVTAKVVEIASGGEITLDGYATETWATNHFLGTNALNNYYTKSQVDAKIPSLTNYITFDWIEGYYNQYVKDYCDTFNTDGTNLLNYVSKEELDGLSYVTSNALSSMGYITQHQDLSDYATKTYVMDKISGVTIDTSDLVSYAYFYEKLSEDESVWAASLTDINTRMSSYVTSDYLSSQSYLTEHQSLTDYVTKNELDSLSYATESYVTTKIAEASIGGGGSTPDLSNYATKEELKSYIVFTNNKTYDGPLKIYSQGIQVNNQYGHISPVNYSYANFISADTNAWMSKGSVVNYVNGRIAEIESSYVTHSYLSNRMILNDNGQLRLRGNGRIDFAPANDYTSVMVFSDRLIPNYTNTKNLGVKSAAWANTYSYNFYSYTASGWLNIGDTLAGLETLLSQI